MSWFSKAFKSVTKEISRTAKRVTKEVGRAASRVGPILASLPVPGMGGLLGSSLSAAGALLQGRSARKYLEAIPSSTIDSLMRGLQIVANPAGVLDAAVNTLGVAGEQFKALRGAGVGIREALSGAQQAAGIVSSAVGSPLGAQGMSLIGNVTGLDLGGILNGILGLAGGGGDRLLGGGGGGAALAGSGGGLLGGSSLGASGAGQYLGAAGSGLWGSLAGPGGFSLGQLARIPIITSGGGAVSAPPGSSTRFILDSAGNLWR